MTFSKIDGFRNFKKKLIWIIVGLFFILTLIIFSVALSPFYFAAETSIEKSDVVIVLVGTDDKAKLIKSRGLKISVPFSFFVACQIFRKL